ncbi:MAG: NUMOD3 domain-containing DNA-binding protein [bacterium]
MNIKNKFKYYIVYKTENILNGKYYIGCHLTNKLDDNYIGSGKYFLRSVKKNGKHNFKREILEFCNENNYLEKEKYWILYYNTVIPNGYNLTNGGEGCIGFKHTDESKKKMKRKLSLEHKNKLSEKKMGNKNRLGKSFTKEQKNKISNTLKNKNLNKKI